MSLSNAGENGLMLLIFQNSNFALVGDATGLRGSSTAGSLYLSLHTADPGEAGDQTTSEATYGAYARVAVARSSSGFTVSANAVTLFAAATFPAATSGSNTLMFFGVGTASTGAGVLLFSGPIGSTLGPFNAATSDTITIPGLSGVAVDDRITFAATLGSTMPTGVTEGTVYFVKTVSGNDITIATTSGGTTVDVTAAGSGVAYKVTPLVVTSSPAVTPSLTTSTQIAAY